MISRPAPAGFDAANDDDVTARVDLLHAVAAGTARPIGGDRQRPARRIADRVTAIARAAR